MGQRTQGWCSRTAEADLKPNLRCTRTECLPPVRHIRCGRTSDGCIRTKASVVWPDANALLTDSRCARTGHGCIGKRVSYVVPCWQAAGTAVQGNSHKASGLMCRIVDVCSKESDKAIGGWVMVRYP